MKKRDNITANAAAEMITQQPEQFDKVLSYLLYEKSLVTFDDGRRINFYLDLAKSLSTGTHISIANRFDRMVSIVFELVLSKKVDPWNIDLITFAREYLKLLKRENELDLFTIGKMVFMAWGILKEKTDLIVEEAERDRYEEEEVDLGPMDYEIEFSEELLEPIIENTFAGNTEAAISEIAWRNSNRSATLLDVVDALADAVEESERRKVIEERRKKLRAHMVSESTMKKEIKDNFHEDNIEQDKDIIWQRINQFNGQPIPFSNICNFRDRTDVITALVSSVHLAQDERINLWQNNFPHGEIFIKNMLIKKNT